MSHTHTLSYIDLKTSVPGLSVFFPLNIFNPLSVSVSFGKHSG